LFPFKLSSANSRVVSFLTKNNICMQNNKNIPKDPDKDKQAAKIISKGLWSDMNYKSSYVEFIVTCEFK
jgi:hypothetical protein